MCGLEMGRLIDGYVCVKGSRCDSTSGSSGSSGRGGAGGKAVGRGSGSAMIALSMACAHHVAVAAPCNAVSGRGSVQQQTLVAVTVVQVQQTRED